MLDWVIKNRKLRMKDRKPEWQHCLQECQCGGGEIIFRASLVQILQINKHSNFLIFHRDQNDVGKAFQICIILPLKNW